MSLPTASTESISRSCLHRRINHQRASASAAESTKRDATYRMPLRTLSAGEQSSASVHGRWRYGRLSMNQPESAIPRSLAAGASRDSLPLRRSMLSRTPVPPALQPHNNNNNNNSNSNNRRHGQHAHLLSSCHRNIELVGMSRKLADRPQ